MPHYTGFKLGRYRLGREKPEGNLHRYWHEPGARNQSRRSLGTNDEAEAEEILATIVLAEGDHTADPRQGAAPEVLNLISVFNHYWTNHSDLRPRSGDARYACNTLHDYMVEALDRLPVVADLSRARQRAFMRHARTSLGHAVSTISRNLSIVNAALNYAAQEQIFEDANGVEREVKLLQYAPKLYYSRTEISEVTNAPMPRPRNDIPALEDLARFIEDIPGDKERLFRFVVLALNTWARPGAIVELGPAAFDAEYGLLDLNPEDRRQTKKRRPVIAVSKALRGWIEHWGATDPEETTHWITYRGEPIDDIKVVFRGHRNRRENGKRVYPDTITRYALRHLMATVAKNAKRPRVPKEQRDVFMGHADPHRSVADGYGIYEPGFLKEAVQVTDQFMVRLNEAIRARAKAENRMPKRLVLAPKVRPKDERAPAASEKDSPRKQLKIVGK